MESERDQSRWGERSGMGAAICILNNEWENHGIIPINSPGTRAQPGLAAAGGAGGALGAVSPRKGTAGIPPLIPSRSRASGPSRGGAGWDLLSLQHGTKC